MQTRKLVDLSGIRELLLLSLVLAGFLLRLFLGILAESNEGVNVLCGCR